MTSPERQSRSANQTSPLVALAGGIGTALSAPFAVVGYTLSNMAASNSSFAHIRASIRSNPYLLFASTGNVTAKLSLASTRILAMPSANKATQLLPDTQQDLATAAIMSGAELPSATAELFEVSKSSQTTYKQLLATAGKNAADNARLLVNLRAPSTWGRFFACTVIKNYPLNYVGARSTRLANEAHGTNNNGDNGALTRVLTATSQLVVSSTIAGSVLQGPLYRSARGYTALELIHSIANPRNVAVGVAKGLAHVPIGLGTFGLMELARSYELSAFRP